MLVKGIARDEIADRLDSGRVIADVAQADYRVVGKIVRDVGTSGKHGQRIAEVGIGKFLGPEMRDVVVLQDEVIPVRVDRIRLVGDHLKAAAIDVNDAG